MEWILLRPVAEPYRKQPRVALGGKLLKAKREESGSGKRKAAPLVTFEDSDHDDDDARARSPTGKKTKKTLLKLQMPRRGRGPDKVQPRPTRKYKTVAAGLEEQLKQLREELEKIQHAAAARAEVQQDEDVDAARAEQIKAQQVRQAEDAARAEQPKARVAELEQQVRIKIQIVNQNFFRIFYFLRVSGPLGPPPPT